MENGNFIKSVIKGTTGSLILSFIGIVVLSMLMTKLVFSKNIYNMIYVIVSLCSLSLGSIIAAKKNQAKGWLVGFCVALGYYLILFILSSSFNGEMTFKLFDVTKLMIALAVGTLSGILGINM